MSLRVKLLWPVALTLLLIIGVSYLYALPHFLELETKQITYHESHKLKILANGLVNPILKSDLAEVHAIINQTREDHDSWVDVRLYDRQDRQLYPLLISKKPTNTRNNKSIYIKREIHHLGKSVGSIFLELNYGLLIKAKQRLLQNILSVSLILILVSVALSAYIQDHVITKPLHGFIAAIKNVAKGDYSIPLEITSKDEMGEFSQTFNKMQKQLLVSKESLILERDKAQHYLDVVEIGIIAIVGDGIITLANRYCCQILGYEESQLIGKNWFDKIVISDNKQHISTEFTAVLRGAIELKRKFEFEVVTAKDQHRFLNAMCHLVKSDDNMPVVILMSLEDITEKRRIEIDLREQRTLFETIFQSIPDGVIIVNKSGTVITVNKVLCELFDFTPAEITGKNISLLHLAYNSSDAQESDKALLKVQKQTIESFKGRIFVAEVVSTSIRSLLAGVSGDIIVVRDITEQENAKKEKKKLQDQLQQAQKMEAIGHLTGGVAHDFNNMLASVLGFALLAREKSENLGDDKLKEYLEQIEIAGNRAKELVLQMLTFSRGSQQNIAPLGLEPIINETIKMLMPMLSSSIRLSANIKNHIPLITSNPIHINQLLV
ncbi:MAG: PAS domain S-box protein, partial [Gammaproteobacteria bacterium]|nr:PAS domain S-box protein [Gammaproteobacteria bacterium]